MKLLNATYKCKIDFVTCMSFWALVFVKLRSFECNRWGWTAVIGAFSWWRRMASPFRNFRDRHDFRLLNGSNQQHAACLLCSQRPKPLPAAVLNVGGSISAVPRRHVTLPLYQNNAGILQEDTININRNIIIWIGNGTWTARIGWLLASIRPSKWWQSPTGQTVRIFGRNVVLPRRPLVWQINYCL